MSGFTKYFLVPLALITVLVMVVAGKQGSMSRRPPIEVFPDMDRQPKLRPQVHNDFFPDELSSRQPVAGAISRANGIAVDGREILPFEDHPVNTGRAAGTTNFVEINPLPISDKLMARGQQRFQINCLPCHGPQGDGKGITTKYGMAVVANLQDPRIVKMPDGEIFSAITYGKNLMGAYGANVTVEDRWAIIYYLRALQLSHVGAIEDVPAGERGKIPNAPPVAKNVAAPK